MNDSSTSNRPKIVIATGIFAPDIGGPASYLLAIGPRLAADADVVVVTYSRVWHDAADSSLPFRVFRVWRRWPWGIRHLLFLYRLWRASRRVSTVFALNAVSAGVPAVRVARMRNARFVVRVVGDYAWDMAVLDGATSLMIGDFQRTNLRGRFARLRKLQTRTCMLADAVIVPSRCIAELISGWGIPQEKVHTVYTGVDLVPSALSKEEARKVIGISGNIVLSAGRVVPLKGFRMLIKIVPQLLKLNQFFRLVVVGDGPQYRELQGMVRNLGLERKVFLVGAKTRQEMPTYLAAADMFVLNTAFEAFSHQLLEAMRAGVPVITTAVGGNREIITQGENGFLVKYNDEFNLVEAIKTIWQNEELRQRFISRGKETAENFGAQRMFSETQALLVLKD